MTGWKIHPATQAELAEALEYYLEIDEQLAVDFDRLYKNHRRKICENPLLYRIRRLPCGV
jgi:hypothetical protein